MRIEACVERFARVDVDRLESLDDLSRRIERSGRSVSEIEAALAELLQGAPSFFFEGRQRSRISTCMCVSRIERRHSVAAAGAERVETFAHRRCHLPSRQLPQARMVAERCRQIAE